MRILLTTKCLSLGGIGVYTVTLAKALKKKGVDVIVASSGGRLKHQLVEAGIEHISIPVNTGAEIGIHMLRAYRILADIIKNNNIDIIHAQTRVTQVLAYMLAKKLNVRVVTTCHGFFKRRLSRRILPCWGNAVIAISDAVREHLVNDMRVLKNKVHLIYNGIDCSRFRDNHSDKDKILIRSEYNLKEITTIGLIARISKVKGHSYLIEAFGKVLAAYPDTQLLIIGDGSVKYLNRLKRLCVRLKLDEKVLFHKACENTAMPLSVIDIFCMPSIQEGLGLALLEAMAMGKPVIASNVGGIYTLIKDKYNGLLVPPKDSDALAEAILSLLNNRDTARFMGECSRELASTKFSLDEMAEQVVLLYKEILDNKDLRNKNDG